jgi:hypothetical protein
MRVTIDLPDPRLCNDCPLLYTVPFVTGKGFMHPECRLGYEPEWKEDMRNYEVERPSECIQKNGK